jgi:DNA transformation protein
MDADGLRTLFGPFGEVSVKRMFGGYGVYADGLCFAIEQGGDVFLKTDADSQPSFAAAESSPFVYEKKGKPMSTSFWRLPLAAYDDGDALRRWASLGVAAARRAAEGKAKPKSPKRRKG